MCKITSSSADNKDVDRLLKELQGIANDLELLRKMPFQAEDVRRIPETVTVTEEDVRMHKETEPVELSERDSFRRRRVIVFTVAWLTC